MWFNNVSRGLADKLDSLWSLAEAHQTEGNEIKQFADQILSLWTSISRQVKFYLPFISKTFYLLSLSGHSSLHFIQNIRSLKKCIVVFKEVIC